MLRYIKFIVPVLVVLLAETLFRLGAWEPAAFPLSHAGTSIRLKRALSDPSRKIDFVTLGSSRPEYGLDHAAIAKLASAHGYVHANLSMPGSHWMSIHALTNWLSSHHSEIRGGIIAMSVQDFALAGNGTYELAIVEPFRTFSDYKWIEQHVPFNSSDMATYGVFSSLYLYRDDVQDLVRHPQPRYKKVTFYRRPDAALNLFENVEGKGDMCRYGLRSLDACNAVENDRGNDVSLLSRQCQELRAAASGRFDFHAAMHGGGDLPAFMENTKKTVTGLLRNLGWSRPPLVILMPVPDIWLRDITPGLHEWALAILEPLAREGVITLIDATDLLHSNGVEECSLFWDFYHQNPAGRDRLAETLLPKIDAALYQSELAVPISAP